MKPIIQIFILLVLSPIAIAPPAYSQEFSGSISQEAWWFMQDAESPEQANNNYSIAFEPELYYQWKKPVNFTFTPFIRWDAADSHRSRIDIRELNVQWVHNQWELTIGIDKVFWGVCEFVHLIDIVNQTDYVESIDGEIKLGQPMLHLSIPQQWGVIDLFALPFFRERIFAGNKGRLRSSIPVDGNQPSYENKGKNNHIDFAFRYSHWLGNWEIGLSHFYGLGREPSMVQKQDENNKLYLAPYYELINQTSLDVQLIAGNWLLKLETFYRSGQGSSFFVTVTGFEYSLVSFAKTKIDLGLIGEWVYDERGSKAPNFFNNDLMLGLRIGINDLANTEIIIGSAKDLDHTAMIGIIEANRRFGSHWKATLTGRGFFNFPGNTPFYGLRNDDYLKFEMAYFF